MAKKQIAIGQDDKLGSGCFMQTAVFRSPSIVVECFLILGGVEKNCIFVNIESISNARAQMTIHSQSKFLS